MSDEEVEQARDAAADAAKSKQGAEDARDDAEDAAAETRSALSGSHAAPDDLLIHPDQAPTPGDIEAFGLPGPPISRRSPFYVGFFGGLGVLVAIFLGMAFQHAQSVLVLILVSGFLAVGLNPLVELLMHRSLRRPWAVLIVTLGVVSLVALFVVALVPVLRDQITALITNAPVWLEKLQTNGTVENLDQKYDVIDKVNEKLQDPKLAQQAFGSVFTVGLAVVNALLNAFLIFVLTLYFLSALPQIKRACYTLAPASRRDRVSSLGDEILRRVGGYVAGAFVVALCAGVSSFIFLQIVGLSEYALALALVVAILDFIPLIGATIGAVVVSLIGLATSPTIGIVCIIFYVIYQQVENYVLYPRVMASSVDVPGVVTVIAVLIGGSLLGVVGALLAIPTAAALLLLLREVLLPRQAVT
ncbi:MAG: AI-2E family transporter [Nocardioidaceae bacterium]